MTPGPVPFPATEVVVVEVRDELDASRARQSARKVAEVHGFDRARVYRIATSVSELATNLYRYADRGGRIELRTVRNGSLIGLEILAEDDGPGIDDLAAALRDGFSTGGGLGGGLPGVRRLMNEFEIESVPGQGTRVTARMWQTCK